MSMTKPSLAAATVALGVAIMGVASTGVAYAYYRGTATGQTTGTATAEAARSIGFTVTGVSAGLLYPGASGNVTVTLSNPYAQAITLSGISGSVSTNHSGCTNSDFTVAPSPSGLPTSLTSSQVATGVVLTNALTMHNDAADACRGAAITVTLSVTGQL